MADPKRGSYKNLRFVEVTPVVDFAGIYASGDVLFDATLIPGAFRGDDANGWLVGMSVLDEDDQAAAQMEFYFTTVSTTWGDPNAAAAATDAAARSIIAGSPVVITSSDWYDLGGAKVGRPAANLMPVPLRPIAASDDVYVAAITRGTPTQTAADKIKLRFAFADAL